MIHPCGYSTFNSQGLYKNYCYNARVDCVCYLMDKTLYTIITQCAQNKRNLRSLIVMKSEKLYKVGKCDFEKTRSKVIWAKMSIFGFQRKYVGSIVNNILRQI